MPIDNAEWDSGKVYPVEDRIMSFLNKKDNVNRAFNLVSIMEGLGYLVTKEPISYELAIQVRKALDKLVEEKKIEKKVIKETIGEEIYYKTVQSTPDVGWKDKLRNIDRSRENVSCMAIFAIVFR